MPPDRESCEQLSNRLAEKSEVMGFFKDLLDNAIDLVKGMFSLKYGGGLVDALTADIVALVGSVASEAAETFLDTASSVSKTVLESVLNPLLKIFLAFPTAVFSLVAIPLEQARKSTDDEARFLGRAQENMNLALSIILKWTKTKSGQEFYLQMRDAMPYIERAIGAAGAMIIDLENEDNSVFDEATYSTMKANIAEAIRITKPASQIDQKFGIVRKMNADKEKRFQAKKKVIIAEYREERRGLNSNHQANMLKIAGQFDTEGNSLKADVNNVGIAANEYAENLEYQERLNLLDAKKNTKLDLAKSEAESEALKNSQNWMLDLGGIAASFAYDMEILGKALSDLVKNTTRAYGKNKESQLFCTNITGMDGLIRNLINELIEMIRSAGNFNGDVVAEPIKSAKGDLEDAQEIFQEDIDKYGSTGITATQLSADLLLGRSNLISADAILNSTITESLIDSINADDLLEDNNDKFNTFLADLANIPDWDTRTGVWAVDIVGSAVSPYLALVSDLTAMLTKVPLLSFSSREADKLEMRQLINESNNTFKRLKRHNGEVRTVLGSYTPYMASEAGDLRSVLASAGVLKTFATTMSVVTVATTLFSSEKSDGLSERDAASYNACSIAFPDLFDDTDKAGANALQEADAPAQQESADFNENSEENEKDVMAIASYLKVNMNFNSQDIG